eukprot:Nitzschia sp. Nitz4//scaffold222_size33694//3280//5255//NITZ4_007860-RA/size33694-augustus-gene-0.21-mRNA-1//1//CDS//3329542585//1628//frame0
MVIKLDFAKKQKNEIPTNWKEALPQPNEDRFITVMCGNSSLYWAVHSGRSDHFQPGLFWKTCAVSEEDMQETSASSVLARYIPPQAQEMIFGQGAPATKDSALRKSQSRRAPILTVYVLSTNPTNEEGVAFLFSELPHRMFHVENSDFFSKEQGCYQTLGVDRAASLYGGFQLCNKTATLVVDGGTAWTYTAIDSNGKIMGGGIAPGVMARFRSLSDYCGRLPLVTVESYMSVFRKAVETKEYPPTFATDTEMNMITSVFQETAVRCRHMVQMFLADLKQKSGTNTVPPAAILVTGGDAPLITEFLRKDCEMFPFLPEVPAAGENLKIEQAKHLSHFGFSNLLVGKAESAKPPTPEDELRMKLSGQRVAKGFDAADVDGDFIYRGYVLSVIQGKDLDHDSFIVRYDDGDQDYMKIDELHDCLKLYQTVGEKKETSVVQLPEVEVTKKKAIAGELADKLAKDSVAVQTRIKEAEAAPVPPVAVAAEKRPLVPSVVEPPKTKKARRSSPKEKQASYINQRVAKHFPAPNSSGVLEDELYFGTVSEFKAGYWHIVYDDDDEEDFDETELKTAILLYDQHRQEDPKAKPDA